MGLFTKLKEPVFYKEEETTEKKLAALQTLEECASLSMRDRIEQERRLIEAGRIGEKNIRFELEHSHIPMYVLQDLRLAHGGLTAQIDYLLITRKRNFVVECKNLVGNIEVNRQGDFIRTISYGRFDKKEGIYSPVTQNMRHLELMKQIRSDVRNNALTKALFEHSFYENYCSIVVLANPKTVLNVKYAPKELRNQVIRADQLTAFIKRVNRETNSEPSTDKQMETLAQFFLENHRPEDTDWVVEYGRRFADVVPPEDGSLEKSAQQLLCPKCGAPMVRRVASKGLYAGKTFYGCTRYPRCNGIINLQ